MPRAILSPVLATLLLTASALPAAAQFGGVVDQFQDMRNSLGMGPSRAPMDFTERPPLVVPPNDTLPPPGSGPGLPVVDTDTANRRKALTDSRRPVPPYDPGANVSGLAGRTYLVDPPAGMRDPSQLGPDPTSDLPRKARDVADKPGRHRHVAKRRTPDLASQ
ncbi:exported protein of unknown function [Beijerinckiaceae bacterium RH AL1]|nr:hypothetical protein [Beijerinckiaceae bacterium]VVB47124.1 exported protein of unknown function [Beijerinckiaceae bacterium RH CH11]VVB47207.1 exported protein of unknown function [Beijerinckiaceae bacterium RH AL8]VVC55727.1 exported protein of unknown function [Beijerinckiaceae bacterium RH AL1]